MAKDLKWTMLQLKFFIFASCEIDADVMALASEILVPWTNLSSQLNLDSENLKKIHEGKLIFLLIHLQFLFCCTCMFFSL